MSILNDDFQVSLGRLEDVAEFKCGVKYLIRITELAEWFSTRTEYVINNEFHRKLSHSEVNHGAERRLISTISKLDVDEVTPVKILNKVRRAGIDVHAVTAHWGQRYTDKNFIAITFWRRNPRSGKYKQVAVVTLLFTRSFIPYWHGITQSFSKNQRRNKDCFFPPGPKEHHETMYFL